MAGTYILGHGLACTLGVGLDTCLDSLRLGDVHAERIQPTHEFGWPYFSIPDTALSTPGLSWHARARELVARVVGECAPNIDRDAPLFVASSSLSIGGLETGAPFLRDQQSFIEEVASWLGWRGPVFSVASACTSSLNALLSAKTLIESGLFENALILGLELNNQFTSAGFSGMQLLAADLPRPLDATRDGLVLGEAVAALYLGKQATRWQLLGGANRVNGDNPVGADQRVVTQIIAQTLDECGLNPAQIHLIKLQAAGSPQNDAEEIAGLQQVFSALPPVVTFKAVMGHTLGASGAAELALLMACLESEVWPATNPQTIDSKLNARCCEVLLNPPAKILANILGFGGGHSCVVIEDTTQ
ncbi:MAG: beta-ketoacyl synthase N-terminal-like domain-containing protein [Thiobacillus sp.]